MLFRSGSRSLPHIEGPNLGKSVFVLVSAIPSSETIDSRKSHTTKSSMTSDVTNPRQLAPTVGPAVKSVTFRAGSMKGAEDLAIGHIIMVDGTPLIDDSSWGPEADYLETGRVIPFGSIHVFVGFIGGVSEDPSQPGDSEEGVAVTVDEEEESTNNEPLTLEDEEAQSIEYVLEERLCGNPRVAARPP